MGRSDVCLNPQGVRVSFEQYKEHLAKGEYLLREYKNDKVHIRLFANGMIRGATNIPEWFWKRFRVEVDDIVATDSDGNMLSTPKRIPAPDASAEYRDRGSAEDHYETFLARYTESKFDVETGVLNEVGNELAPPDPDVPVISEESPIADDFGSW